ncbi:hypothetical protein P4215_32715 [Bacillus thuringiensis]|nr:hypothetical protein [Bacillus thuringiensis]
MNEIAQFISQVGFPIFTAIFMMTKQSKDTQAMTGALTDLKIAIEKNGGGKHEQIINPSCCHSCFMVLCNSKEKGVMTCEQRRERFNVSHSIPFIFMARV